MQTFAAEEDSIFQESWEIWLHRWLKRQPASFTHQKQQGQREGGNQTVERTLTHSSLPCHPACPRLRWAQTSAYPRPKNVQQRSPPSAQMENHCGGVGRTGAAWVGRGDGRKGRKDEDGLGSELAVFHRSVSDEIRGTEKRRSPQEAQSSQASLLGARLGI